MNEPIVFLLLGIAPILWMAGGTWWKGFRRIVWPIIAASILTLSGLEWWRGIILCSSLFVVCSLPYGDRTPIPVKIFVFFLIGVPALAISFKAWPAIIGAGIITSIGFLLTNRWPPFTHKIFEAWAGLAQASAIVVARLI